MTSGQSQDSRTALITGASSGIGAAFARQLAAAGYDLILVARRKERLERLSGELERNHPIRAETLVADLSRTTDIERVEGRVVDVADLDMLINNAGYGMAGHFSELEVREHLDMIQVHVVATVRLCRAALPGMLTRRRGALINVSSIAALMPLPGGVTYVATKAYLIAFSEALQQELRGTGVRVQALCPGLTDTEFYDRPVVSTLDPSRLPRAMWMSADQVVAASLKALGRQQVLLVPGAKNRLIAAMVRGRIPALILRSLSRRGGAGK